MGKKLTYICDIAGAAYVMSHGYQVSNYISGVIDSITKGNYQQIMSNMGSLENAMKYVVSAAVLLGVGKAVNYCLNHVAFHKKEAKH